MGTELNACAEIQNVVCAQNLNVDCVRVGKRCGMARTIVKDRQWKQKPNGLFSYRTVAKSVWRPTQPRLV